ncbi:MAG: CASTOR/POLLUX-related putative ion channel, partial [Thermodesulfobacteriota bacterium]
MKIGNLKSKIVNKYTNSFRFRLERLLLRGAGYRLLFIALLIGLVTALGGLLALVAAGGFSGSGEALWWAFLRLSDPGYLGDDQGLVLRSISTVLTVLGYVLFMGSLIAILTQWLNQTIHRLEQGLTPISKKNHVVILGWTNHTPLIVRELVLSRERVKRFLRRHGARDLSLVVLCEEVSAEYRLELIHHLGPEWDEGQIIFRSGSPLRLEHLQRVDFLRAAAIILPGSDFIDNGAELMDAKTVKTLLSISRADPGGLPEQLPLLTAEMYDIRKVSLAQSAYKGESEIVPGDAVISRLLIQNVRQHWLSLVYNDLLSHGSGNEIFLKEFPDLVGVFFEQLRSRFLEAIPLGVLRKQEGRLIPRLNPPDGLQLKAGDRLVFLSQAYDCIIPGETEQTRFVPQTSPEKESGTLQFRRILFLGWNDRMPQLIQELNQFARETFQLDILSRVPARERT